ncbi:hypothetical protein PRK78_005671 [Emydomyces testavorans]|uniref:Uncharacterized protein n=1 Tax=Emydomyces testavorans TaxID=2070801 RepID=A0AAF0DMM4_9EURO|nr:hypothetical protein PRK78_005671 [Emydomyces testavorans]
MLCSLPPKHHLILSPSVRASSHNPTNCDKTSGIETITQIMSDNKQATEKARESFSSILSYYLANRESLQSIPSWLDEASDTGSILIALSPSLVPVTSDDRVEEIKEDLKEQLAVQEALQNLSEKEKALMIQAANTSRIKRKENKQK